ncbi:MAG: CBS domain-containing protein, partial [Gammaproteobacteria bacterium]
RLLLKVGDIMHTGSEFPLANPNDFIFNSLITMTEKGLGILVVADDSNALLGVFTDGDLRRCINQDIDIKSTKISEVMSKSSKTIDREDLAYAAEKIMENNNVYTLVVMENNAPIGVIRMHDLMQAGLV